MSIKKDFYGAEVLLDFDLDPAAREWESILNSKDSSRETYRSADYTINLKEEHKPDFTIVDFNLKREDGHSFTVKRYVLKAYSYMNDVFRFRKFLHGYDVPMILGDYGSWELGIMSWDFTGRRTAADRGLPIILGTNRTGNVTLGVGFIDQRIETMLTARVNTLYPSSEKRGTIVYQLSRPVEGFSIGPVSEFKDAYFVAKGSYWFDTMQTYSQINAEKMRRPVKPSPDSCWDPLWAPWVAKPGMWDTMDIFADVDEELLLKAMKIGVKLGIKNIINWGSWFLKAAEKNWLGQMGDWLPDTAKFPDLHEFHRKLHRMGVRACVWIAPFTVGEKAKIREKMEDYLINVDIPKSDPLYETAAASLCPRNPVVQKHVADLMARVLRDYEADGYTVDMIDSMRIAPCNAVHEHNFSSFGMAVDYCFSLMKEAMDRVKPDAIIEFRLSYANINNLNYATAFRAVDSGFTGDYELNRRFCVFLRSYVPPGVAVHTDPMWWRIDEDDKTVAKMLSTMIVSGVPQLALDLINIPESHRSLIKGWLGFYQQHKEDFRYGQMRPIQNDPEFSTILISSPSGKAFISYGNFPALRVPLTKDVNEIYLFNCTLEDSLHTILQGIKGEYKAELYDHTLTAIGKMKVKSKKDEALMDLNVPQGGYVVLKRT